MYSATVPPRRRRLPEKEDDSAAFDLQIKGLRLMIGVPQTEFRV